MIKIRKSIFETNSSSVHTMTICSKKEFKKFESGDIYFDCYNNKMISLDVIKKEFKKENTDEDFNDWLKDNEYKTYDTFDDEYLEYYEKEYKSESGDEIVIFGHHGMDN